MEQVAVSDISLEHAELFASQLFSVALTMTGDYTLMDVIAKANLTDAYKGCNRSGCQRIGKAFKRLTIPTTKQGTPPFVQVLGYNKDTKMSYRTVL